MTHNVSILIVDYPYTLKLTAPMTVVIKGKVNTGGKVLFGGTITLRGTKGARVMTLSGAKAVAAKRPHIASVLPTRNCAGHSLVRLTTSLRDSDRRPLTGTIVRRTGTAKVSRATMRSFRTLPKGNLFTIHKRSLLLNKDISCVGRGMAMSSALLSRTRGLTRRKGAPLLFTGGRAYTNLVTMTSALGRSDPRTITRLHSVKVHIVVLAKSGRHATGTVNTRTNISRIVTNMLPRNGRTRVHGLGRRNGMTVIKSKVGSTPTLAQTSAKVTVNTKASITVSTTSIILMGDHLQSIPITVHLDQTALQGVRRGLF